MDIGMNDGGKGRADNYVDPFKEDFAVILLQGRNSFGDSIYSYVEVALPDIKRLHAALNSGKDFTPSDFGTILNAGKGAPTDALRREMAATYNNVQQAAPAAVIPKTQQTAPVQKKAWDEY